jgi:hypothetical protein
MLPDASTKTVCSPPAARWSVSHSTTIEPSAFRLATTA